MTPLALSSHALLEAFSLPGFRGREAQRRMEPRTRGRPPTVADVEPPREAAALAYVFPRDGRLLLPLTVRRPDLAEHRGQVALPGGRPEAGETLWDTARREAREEVSLRAPAVRLLGVLAPVYIPVTHTRLHVHVATGADPGRLEPCPLEVERIVIVPLESLLDPNRRRVEERTVAGRRIPVPYFDVGGLFLWGATAMALSELAMRLEAVSAA